MTAEPITLDPSQEAGAELAATARIGVLTGGPGTGKSTILRHVLDRLDREGRRYLLAAPTGKAARRVQETTGRPAKTIHRMLGFGPFGFAANDRDPLGADAVFIDEASMLDIELADALLSAVDFRRTRLILIGDADQLPPVGPGRPFADLVESGLVPVARLTHLHRSAADSWIAVNAQEVLAGRMVSLEPRADFRWVPVERADEIMPALVRLVTDTIPKEIDQPFQVLIPQRPGVAGIETANAQLQERLNPRADGDPYLPRGKSELRVGDRVIQTRNDYQLKDSTGAMGVFNGEIGDITTIAKGGVTVAYPDRGDVAYTLEQSNALQHAYALTVHRYQGSETPWAVVVCHSTHTKMLTRQLLYTAITRGKRGVVLVGDELGIRRALGVRQPPERNSGLIDRMRGSMEAVVLS